LFQAGESVVDLRNAAVEDDRVVTSFIQRNVGLAAATLQAIAAAGVIDNQPAHLLGGQVEKVQAILAADGGAGEHSHAELVDQGGGLKRVGVKFLPKINGGEVPQLTVDSGDELAAGFVVSAAPLGEQEGEVG
jgi:hypothetical protein